MCTETMERAHQVCMIPWMLELHVQSSRGSILSFTLEENKDLTDGGNAFLCVVFGGAKRKRLYSSERFQLLQSEVCHKVP